MIKLHRWFEEEKRDLPWRTNRSPYAVWVSEMMLQQTQVAVVIPYFERWMQRFPTVKQLAEAHIDDVIKMWEGLGYYSRARYLHAGAQHILKHHNGIIPNSQEALKKIKGLGPYTTGAILSFAFHQRVPAVDGNVIRVLCRYFNISDDISKPATIKKIWNIAESFLPENESWITNEALIELGATICTRTPKCHICPLKASCKSFLSGKPSELPYKSVKTKIEALHRAVAVVQFQNKWLIKRGQQGEIMSDLHEFPYFNTDENGLEKRSLQKKVSEWLGCKLIHEQTLPNVSHSFTRFKVQLTPILFTCASIPTNLLETSYQWLSPAELSNLAFSSGHRKIIKSLNLQQTSNYI